MHDDEVVPDLAQKVVLREDQKRPLAALREGKKAKKRPMATSFVTMARKATHVTTQFYDESISVVWNSAYDILQLSSGRDKLCSFIQVSATAAGFMCAPTPKKRTSPYTRNRV